VRISGLSTGGAREARERLWSPFCTPLAELISLDPKAETSDKTLSFSQEPAIFMFFVKECFFPQIVFITPYLTTLVIRSRTHRLVS